MPNYERASDSPIIWMVSWRIFLRNPGAQCVDPLSEHRAALIDLGITNRYERVIELNAKAIVNVVAPGERDPRLVEERAINALGLRRTDSDKSPQSIQLRARVFEPALTPLELSEFDDFDLFLAARFAFERALVVIDLVRLDAGQPHRRAACASRMFDFLM